VSTWRRRILKRSAPVLPSVERPIRAAGWLVPSRSLPTSVPDNHSSMRCALLCSGASRRVRRSVAPGARGDLLHRPSPRPQGARRTGTRRCRCTDDDIAYRPHFSSSIRPTPRRRLLAFYRANIGAGQPPGGPATRSSTRPSPTPARGPRESFATMCRGSTAVRSVADLPERRSSARIRLARWDGRGFPYR